MRLDVAKHWYRSSHTFLAFCLLPLSLLFGVIVSIRRTLYRCGIKKTYQAPVPVIIVGNITVGGTGKTPFVIWLANFLREAGFNPGIVSRGQGGQLQRAPRRVDMNSNPAVVGDEALLLAQRTGCPVVVGIDRVAAVKKLLADCSCNIVISDDGLQHYRLGRSLEIAMVDGVRRFGNASLLPAGPLREPITRLQEVDFVVTQQAALNGEYEMNLLGDESVALHDANIKKPLTEFGKVHAVAGIGHPQRFFTYLRAQGLEVIEHIFPDHYHFAEADLNFNDDLPVLMTEKDAVKCTRFAKARHWYLPVVAQLDAVFTKNLMLKLGEVR